MNLAWLIWGCVMVIFLGCLVMADSLEIDWLMDVALAGLIVGGAAMIILALINIYLDYGQ